MWAGGACRVHTPSPAAHPWGATTYPRMCGTVFSNMVRDAFLHELAEVDSHDLIKQVQEYYADFVPLDGAHFTLPVQSNTAAQPPLAHLFGVDQVTRGQARARDL